MIGMNYSHLRLKKIDFFRNNYFGTRQARQGEICRQKHLHGKNKRKGKRH